MQITIDIIDRNFDQIKEFCEFNNIKVEDYIVQCVEDDFFTRKYGDLNEKIGSKEQDRKTEEKPITEETPKVEKKKVGRPKKVVEEKPTVIVDNKKENEIQEIVKNTQQVFVRKEDIIDTIEVKPTKVKRTLKTK